MPHVSKEPEFKADALRKLIGEQAQSTQHLFAKVINMYAGFNIVESSEKELHARVRREIEDSLK
jgi:hypothetical protein